MGRWGRRKGWPPRLAASRLTTNQELLGLLPAGTVGETCFPDACNASMPLRQDNRAAQNSACPRIINGLAASAVSYCPSVHEHAHLRIRLSGVAPRTKHYVKARRRANRCVPAMAAAEYFKKISAAALGARLVGATGFQRGGGSKPADPYKEAEQTRRSAVCSWRRCLRGLRDAGRTVARL